MSERPLRMLDLFAGAGGSAVGYHRAGFAEIVGVDIAPQKNYPFRFLEADAVQLLRWLVDGHGFGLNDPGPFNAGKHWNLSDFDAIHASPPCQGYSRLRHLPWLKEKAWPRLIDPVRELLDRTELPWVIENVEDAPLGGIVLCGRMFGLPTYRHRRFASNVYLWSPQHGKHAQVIGSGRMLNDRRKAGGGSLNSGSRRGAWGRSEIVTVAGGQFRKDQGERALGIDWMSKDELAQAIPPAYTRHVGVQLIAHIRYRESLRE